MIRLPRAADIEGVSNIHGIALRVKLEALCALPTDYSQAVVSAITFESIGLWERPGYL
jgi:hypothetical protein